MSKTVTLDLKTLKGLKLNESVQITKGGLNKAMELIVDLESANAAYSFVVETTNPRAITITRRLPSALMDRALYFDSVKKTELKKALKVNNNVKVKAAASLGMSPRTFRRKLAEHNI